MAVAPKNRAGSVTPEDSLNELAQLAGTAGAIVVGRLIQSLPVPTKAYYIGNDETDETCTDHRSHDREVDIDA